ncbi:SCO4402 family protein [Streptomyces fungicidicus]
MPPDDTELRTPWLRDQLIDWLRKIGDRGWQEEKWTLTADSGLDHMLDFFDDTGVLDDPVGRVGFILRDEGEVHVMRRLNSAIDQAIQASPGSDVGIIRSQSWELVVVAAREALQVMAVDSSRSD